MIAAISISGAVMLVMLGAFCLIAAGHAFFSNEDQD